MRECGKGVREIEIGVPLLLLLLCHVSILTGLRVQSLAQVAQVFRKSFLLPVACLPYSACHERRHRTHTRTHTHTHHTHTRTRVLQLIHCSHVEDHRNPLDGRIRDGVRDCLLSGLALERSDLSFIDVSTAAYEDCHAETTVRARLRRSELRWPAELWLRPAGVWPAGICRKLR